jgi:hypothetical protein
MRSLFFAGLSGLSFAFSPATLYALQDEPFEPSAEVASETPGAAIVKKTGLLAAMLIFGKKFIVIIIAGIAAAFGAVKRFFTAHEEN